MKNVFINALNAKDGGGLSYLTNFIKLLSKHKTNDQYFVLVPPSRNFDSYNQKNITIINVYSFFASPILLPISYIFLIPLLIFLKKCNVVFNLSDLPILTNRKQVMLFDWPYGLYPETVAWNLMDRKDYIKRIVKLFFVKLLINNVNIFVTQNSVMKKRLKEIYNFQRVEIIPNATSLDNLNTKENLRNFNFKNKINLLYLTYYYSHKNIEIFVPLAKEILKQKLDIGIVITISSKQGKQAKDLLKIIEEENINSVIHNLGPVDMKDVPALYKQTDGLLMPTLLETFSGTYVEAMYHKKPIFTSDLDFARNICKESAFYFDPLNHLEILEVLKNSFSDEKILERKVSSASKVLETYPTWEQAFLDYMALIDE